MNKTVAQSNNVGLVYDQQGFLGRVLPLRPVIVVFNGKDHVEDFCRYTGDYVAGFGLQDWSVGESLAVVLPSSSPRVEDSRPCRGVASKTRPAIDYWHKLASLLARQPKGREPSRLAAQASSITLTA